MAFLDPDSDRIAVRQAAVRHKLTGFKTHKEDIKNKIRNKPLAEQYQESVSKIVRSLGPGWDVKIVSGGQDSTRRTGSSRHDVDHTGHGHTSDFVLTHNGKTVLPSQNKKAYADLIERSARVFTGIGHYSWGVHIGTGKPAMWGPDTTSNTVDPVFAKAYQRGRNTRNKGVTSYQQTSTAHSASSKSSTTNFTDNEIFSAQGDQNLLTAFMKQSTAKGNETDSFDLLLQQSLGLHQSSVDSLNDSLTDDNGNQILLTELLEDTAPDLEEKPLLETDETDVG